MPDYVPQNIIGYTGSPQTILVVDDIPENRQMLRDMLTPFGFQVVLAENGLVAWDKLEDITPDIILTDIIMPIMSGIDLMKKIRSVKAYDFIPIVAITASISKLKQDKLSEMCEAILSKPFKEADLLETIAKELKLEWVYETSPNDVSDQVLDEQLNVDMADLVLPSATELEELYELAMLGMILEVEKKSRQLEKTDIYRPFAQQLQYFTGNFNDSGLLTFLESYITV